MAKRFNVSIPDALAERLEPHKDKISLSAVMQAALERELAQLTMGDQEKQRRDSFKAAAMSAWLGRNHVYTRVINAFVGHLFDKALNDGLGDIFDFYRNLYLFCRREELEERVANSYHFKLFRGFDGQDWRERVRHALGRAGFHYEEEVDEFILGFIRGECKNPSELIRFGSSYPVDEKGLPLKDDPFWLALCSPATYHVILQVLDDRIKAFLSEEEIEKLIFSFDSEFHEMEFFE